MATHNKLDPAASPVAEKLEPPALSVTENLPEPPADLLSLTTMLERALNPRLNMNVKIRPLGLFGLPEDLIKSVEGNTPFSWRAKLWGCNVEGGKFCPRELTEEEIEAIKTKKTAKPTKDAKDKAETKIAIKEGFDQPDWVSEVENKYKFPSISFPLDEPKPKIEETSQAKPGETTKGLGPQSPGLNPARDLKASPTIANIGEVATKESSDEPFDPEGRFKFKIEGDNLVDMEQALQTGHALLVVERYPNMNEEELGKLRKKLKGAALKDLRPLVLHIKLPMDDLQKPGSTTSVIRAPVKQVGDFASEEECNEYKFVNTYAKIEISGQNGELFTPEINDLFPPVSNLSDKVPVPKISNKKEAEGNFNNCLRKALITLSDDYRSTIKVDPTETQQNGNEKLTMHKQQQLLEKKRQNQKNYIDKFLVGHKYGIMKNELAPYILRLVHDKLEKEMVGDKSAHLDADKLLSELNIYFQCKLEETISSVITRAVDIDFHKDFVESFVQERNLKQSFMKQMGDPKSAEKLLDLAKEYEKLNLKVMAEKRFKDLVMDPEMTDFTILSEFMAFDLRQLNYVRAEDTLDRIFKATPQPTDEQKLIKACFFIHRGLISRAMKIVEELLESNKFTPLHNTFMAFMQIFYMNRPKLGKKYFAVSQRMKQRELGLIPPPKLKPDKNPEKLPDLPEKESDELWLDLASFFTGCCFVDLSFKVIELVKDKNSFRCLTILSTLEFLRNNLDKADEILDKMLNVGGPQVVADVYMLKATNAFAREYYYESEELIHTSWKLAGSLGLSDMVMMSRLGYIYLNRRSFDDAKSVLRSACVANPKSALNWLGLGISCMRIGERLHMEADICAEADNYNDENIKRNQGDEEYQMAEDALRMANIYDPTNSDVWCYAILLSLKDTRKLQQASKLLNYLMALEVENIELLMEVLLL